MLISSPKGDRKDKKCCVVTRSQAKNGKGNNKKRSSTNDTEDIEEENGWVDMYKDEEERFKYIDGNKVEIIKDTTEIELILKEYHDSVFGGHFGIFKTLHRIKRRYFWIGMRQDVINYVNRCPKCQRNKHTRETRMPCMITEVAKKPFDKIYIDLVVNLPCTNSGNRHILSMVDDLTRFVDFVAVPDMEAPTIAKVLYEQILSRYSVPKVIVSDNGANFIGNVFK